MQVQYNAELFKYFIRKNFKHIKVKIIIWKIL